MFIRRLRQDEFKAGQSFVADTFHHRLVNLKQDGQNSRQTQLATPEGTWVSQNKFEQAGTQNTKAKIGLEFGDCLTHLVIWGQPRSYTQLPNKKGISISISSRQWWQITGTEAKQEESMWLLWWACVARGCLQPNNAEQPWAPAPKSVVTKGEVSIWLFRQGY